MCIACGLVCSIIFIKITTAIVTSQPLRQVLDDIYSKIVEPLRADVYVVSSDERWVRCPSLLHFPAIKSAA
jgi:hypothetical protein